MALRGQPYIPLYVQDFMTDEKLNECSAESTGVYIRIMCVMHKSETYGMILLKQKDKREASDILNFASKLQRHMPYPAEVIERALTELIDEGVLIIEGDSLIQKRMVRDEIISSKRADSGSKGGKATQSRRSDSDFAKASAKAKSKANSEYEYEIESENESTKKPKKPTVKGFDVFWSAYPRKVAKPNALKAFEKVQPDDALLRLMLAAIERDRVSPQWQKDGGQYIPHAATWLNGRRWEDEIPIPPPARERKINILSD